MSTTQNGCTAAVRAFVAANPHCTQDQVRVGVAFPLVKVNFTIRTMRRYGTLLDPIVNGVMRLSVGFMPKERATAEPGSKLEKNRERWRRSNQKRRNRLAAEAGKPPPCRRVPMSKDQLRERDKLKKRAKRAAERAELPAGVVVQRQRLARAEKPRHASKTRPASAQPKVGCQRPETCHRPAQSYEDWLAQGNTPEVLAGPGSSIPRQIQVRM